MGKSTTLSTFYQNEMKISLTEKHGHGQKMNFVCLYILSNLKRRRLPAEILNKCRLLGTYAKVLLEKHYN